MELSRYSVCPHEMRKLFKHRSLTVSETLQPGDKVTWKRIPGGGYVYPVQAIVLELTAKRVKIEVDDDGEML